MLCCCDTDSAWPEKEAKCDGGNSLQVRRCRTMASGSARAAHHPCCRFSGRFQSPDFRLKLEPQLRAFVVRQPVRHLRKDGPVKQDRLRLPWQLLRRAGFGQNLVEFGAHRIGIGPVFGRGCILAEQVVGLLAGKGRVGCRAPSI
jgi:hypothetical protein